MKTFKQYYQENRQRIIERQRKYRRKCKVEQIVEETWEKILSQMDWTDEVYRTFGSSEQKIEALQEGLWDYLEKQFKAALLSEREKVKRYREALEDLVLFSEARYNHLPIWIKAKEALNSPATEEGGA